MLTLVLTAMSFGPADAAATVEREFNSPNDDATGLLLISPVRIERDVEPGVRFTEKIVLTNDSDSEIDITLSGTDLGTSSDPFSIAAKTEDGEFGAGDWIEPEITDLRLAPWEKVSFELRINPPLDAPVGTNLGALSVDTTVATGAIGTGDFEGSFRVESLVQLFLTVPGPVEHKLRIKDVDVRDALVTGSQRFAVWDVTFSNQGTVNEHVSGTVDIKSMFGNSVHRVRIEELIVLRGAERTVRVVWNDVPWVGAFTPTVRVRGDDARPVRATGERVVVFPWWLPIVIGLLVVMPIGWLWWRRRQEWKLYLDDDTWDEYPEWGDHEDDRVGDI